MKTVAQINNGLTELGNLKREVANAIREQGVAQFLGDFTKAPKGYYVLHVADVDGKPVYLKIDISVSAHEAILAEPKGKEVGESTIGDIFA